MNDNARTPENERILRGRILELALELGALQYGEFILSSGQSSNYYFDGRLLTLYSEGAGLVTQALLPLIQASGAEAVGGPTIGADPMVGALVHASHLEGMPLCGFLVRSEVKAHGTRRIVEGPLKEGSRVAILDDTCSTGGSLLHAIAAAEAMDCQVVKVLSLLDRAMGGGDGLRTRGYDFTALLGIGSEGTVTVL
jgi:orotate phosphoribosyltransferase